MTKKPINKQAPVAQGYEKVIPFMHRPFNPADHLMVGHHIQHFNRVARVIHYSSDFVLYEARELSHEGRWHHLGIFRRPTHNFLADYEQMEGPDIGYRIQAVVETNQELKRHG